MPSAHIVIGLGYGDEGKGSWVDHLVREHRAKFVLRFNGGAQALHHVVTPDGRVHGFAQFGSGTFVPETMTCHLSYMLVEPEALIKEAATLERVGVKDALDRLLVSENAPVISPFNRLLNRIMETHRRGERHGSCGFGIGLTQADVEELHSRALYVRDLSSSALAYKLQWLKAQKVERARRFLNQYTESLVSELEAVDIGYYLDFYAEVSKRFQVVSDEYLFEIVRHNSCVFEGAQGVLLDQSYGFFPHCTRSTCTFENAEAFLKRAGFSGDVNRIGLLRAYGTRHGAGPFVTEDAAVRIAPCHNQENNWQGAFRTGWFDAVTARYALKVVGGVDTLAITNIDRLAGLRDIKIAQVYEGTDERFFDRTELRIPDRSLESFEPELQR